MNGLTFQNFSKFEPILACLKSKKILEKSGDLAQNWADWYINGSLFLEKWVFVWVYFQILQQHIPTKLEHPPPRFKHDFLLPGITGYVPTCIIYFNKTNIIVYPFVQSRFNQ